MVSPGKFKKNPDPGRNLHISYHTAELEVGNGLLKWSALQVVGVAWLLSKLTLQKSFENI